MIKFKFISTNNKGLTLVEVIVTLAIFLIIVPVITVVLTTVTKGFTSFEASNTLKKTNQNTLNRIYLRLSECKRIFPDMPPSGSSNSKEYIDIISTTDRPDILANSKLSVIKDDGSVNPGTPQFVFANTGNSLLFANYDSISTTTMKIDLYRFNYYYLTSDNPKSIRVSKSYRLVEWISIQYADYYEIDSITDGALKSKVIAGLVDSGIIYAWNTSDVYADTSGSTKTFYRLAKTGPTSGNINPQPNHIIEKYQYTILTEMATGIMGGGYGYGISGNSVNRNSAGTVISYLWSAPKEVPQYGITSGDFPGGFEVVIVGPASGRKVLLRSVLVAQGSMPGILADDQLVLCSARDLW